MLVGQILSLFNEITIQHKFLYCEQGIFALSYCPLILKQYTCATKIEGWGGWVWRVCKEAYFKIFLSFSYFKK